MQPIELDALDQSDLRAMLVCAIDDLLRLAAAVLHGSPDGGESDAQSLIHTWAWDAQPNCYSDGTVIAATSTAMHLYAPPGRRTDTP